MIDREESLDSDVSLSRICLFMSSWYLLNSSIELVSCPGVKMVLIAQLPHNAYQFLPGPAT